MNIRPKPEDCLKWAESVGFANAMMFDLKPYHYGIVLTKTDKYHAIKLVSKDIVI